MRWWRCCCCCCCLHFHITRGAKLQLKDQRPKNQAEQGGSIHKQRSEAWSDGDQLASGRGRVGVHPVYHRTSTGDTDLDSLQRVLMENKRLETRNRQLAAENQQLKEENNRLKENMTDRILDLEQQSRQLNKMKKHRTDKLLELELANKAQAQLLEEWKRLHKICLQQAATLVDARHKMHQQQEKPSRPAGDKTETMEQWLRSGLKSDRKRCRQNMEKVKSKKRLKTSSLRVEKDPKNIVEATMPQKKKDNEEIKHQADVVAKPLAISSGAMWKEFELLDARCSRAHNSLSELDWHVEYRELAY